MKVVKRIIQINHVEKSVIYCIFDSETMRYVIAIDNQSFSNYFTSIADFEKDIKYMNLQQDEDIIVSAVKDMFDEINRV